jgi:hypothetical protein
MRRFLFCLLLAGGCHLYAQEGLQTSNQSPNGEPTLAQLFAQFSTSQAVSGLFMDQSTPLVDVKLYNGAALNSNNKVNPMRFSLAYARVFGSVVNANVSLPAPEVVLGRYAKDNDTVPIKIMLYDYHRLRADAISAGDVSVVNNQLINVPGRNPLESATLFMARGCVKSQNSVFGRILFI